MTDNFKNKLGVYLIMSCFGAGLGLLVGSMVQNYIQSEEPPVNDEDITASVLLEETENGVMFSEETQKTADKLINKYRINTNVQSQPKPDDDLDDEYLDEPEEYDEEEWFDEDDIEHEQYIVTIENPVSSHIYGITSVISLKHYPDTGATVKAFGIPPTNILEKPDDILGEGNLTKALDMLMESKSRKKVYIIDLESSKAYSIELAENKNGKKHK